MPKIKQAPDGERTSVDGTEALPLSSSDSVSSWWTPISRIAEYIRTLTQTLTGKTVNLSNNTLTGTTAQFNTALSDNDFATLAGSETLTNKTLTTPTIGSLTNAQHNHENAAGGGTVDEDALALTDVTTNNSSTSKHGFLKKLDNTATNFMDGTGNWDSVKDSDLSTSDITTNNSTTTKHGFLAKLSGDSDTYMNGDGEWTTPTVSGSVATDAIWDAKGDLAAGTGANAASRLPIGATGYVLTADSDESVGMGWAAPSGGSGALVQKVATQTGTSATGTTTIPMDNTIPQNTEGDEYMTRSITPTNSSNILYITVTVFVSHSVLTTWDIVALFQDTTANALAVGIDLQETAFGGRMISFIHKMTAGTTSSTTFKVRAGGNNAGTLTFNGTNGNQFMGGVMASSIVIEEVTP